jgi:hypothetical protein
MTRGRRPLDWESLLWTVGLVALVVVRVPSLVAPAGSDQSLYMYAADRILAGGAPYVDAWDQKPPGVQLIYTAIRAVWPASSAAAFADLVASALTALLLVGLGRRLGGARAGFVAATVFLLWGDPSIARLDGLYLRGQCEVFIALAITMALWLVWHRPAGRPGLLLAGICLGAAFWIKYNAAVYAVPVLIAAMAGTDMAGSLRRAVGWMLAGALVVSAGVLAFLAAHGALTDLWLATISYNLAYSGETYSGGWTGAVRYAAMLPIHRMRTDYLWFLGGVGILLTSLSRELPPRTQVVAWLWLAASLGSILVNGARDLPQYFLQAKPALALAFGLGVVGLVARPLVLNVAAALVLVAGLWRVGTDDRTWLGLRWGGLPQAVENVRFDVDRYHGRIDRETYLSRFRGQQKYDARESDDLSRLIRETTAPDDRIYVFGFSPLVYLETGRESASRFFWSRPVILEFAADRPGYGSAGLLADLERTRPAVVALQKKDWGPREPTSHAFMLASPTLGPWLSASYTLERDTPFFSIWRRR